jgi:hypothetical protein
MLLHSPKDSVPSTQQIPLTNSDSGLDPLEPFRVAPFAEVVTELERLLSQTQRVFLLGAGCSKCAELPLMSELTSLVVELLVDKPQTSAVLEALKANFAGAKDCTIEDYMSELVDLVCIADRHQLRGAVNPKVLLGGSPYSSQDLIDALSDIKQAIAETLTRPSLQIDTHREFIRVIHNILLSGRANAPQRVDYYTLNYDTLFEDALALERIPFSDGFIGGATGWWDTQSYVGPHALARVFKVHGSIDWCLCDNDVLPRRVRRDLKVNGQRERVLIWPASTKYRETQRDPYAQIVTFMRQSLRPPVGAEVVLTICGYAFNDSHINIEVDRALRESERRLTVIAFTSEDAPSGQLQQWLEDPLVRDQVRIHTNKGFFHGSTIVSSERPLAWWKFEVLCQLLGGQR